jgi:ADP-heptose:LPS heptosyltransferase
LARARRRIGPSFAREGARLFYSAVAAPSGQERHAVMQCLDTAKHLGLDTLPVEFPVRFPKQALTGASPRVALVPFSRWPTKNWPAASFVQLVRRLRERLNAGIFLVGGNDSRGVCGEIERHAGAVENAAGRLTLIQTGSLLAEMDLVIANDSGPMHMAAALGVPVLAIFGPTDPVRTGPYGAKHRVLTAPVPCRPCYRRTCRFGDIRCLAGIRPETVADAAVEMLCR